MKILLLNDDFPPEGASSVANVAASLANAYEAKGHDVHTLTTHRREYAASVLRTDHTTSIPVSYRPGLRHIACLGIPTVSRAIKFELKRLKPDVVHAHNVHQFLTYDALRIAHKLSRRIVVSLHDVFSFAFARVATQHYLDSEGTDARLSLRDHINAVGMQWNPLRNVWIRHVLQRHAHAVVAVSNALQNAAEQNGLRDVRVIHNGIRQEIWCKSEDVRRSFRAKYDLNDSPVVLFGGRISGDKGVAEIVDAMQYIRRVLPTAKLLVVGQEERWKRATSAMQTDMEFVRCTGWLPYTSMPSALAASDVVALPSVCLDSFPTTNLEAMAAGKPVVGTIFGGTPEAVVHGKTGYVCDPRNAKEFARYVIALLQDDVMARKMGGAGQQRVKELFSVEQMAENYLALFSE